MRKVPNEHDMTAVCAVYQQQIRTNQAILITPCTYKYLMSTTGHQTSIAGRHIISGCDKTRFHVGSR